MRSRLSENVSGNPLRKFNLHRGTQLWDFFHSNIARKEIYGPVGSGKTQCCVAFLEKCILEMPADEYGLRRTRGIVVRENENHLSIPIEDWNDVFCERNGWGEGKAMRRADVLTSILKRDLEDGTKVEATIEFRGIGKKPQLAKVLGKNATWIWVNECSTIHTDYMSQFFQRTRRYPHGVSRSGAWCGLLADSNPGPRRNWVTDEIERKRHGFEYETTAERKVWVQAPGAYYDPADKKWTANEEAENLEHLAPTYYSAFFGERGTKLTQNRRKIGMEAINDSEGELVWGHFSEDSHVRDFEPSVFSPLLCGMDFGLHSAVVFGELIEIGSEEEGLQIRIFDAMQTNTELLGEYSTEIARKMNYWMEKKGYDPKEKSSYYFWGDPFGDTRDRHTGLTSYEILKEKAGIEGQKTHTNAIDVRLNSVGEWMVSQTQEGVPRLIVHKNCKTLISYITTEYVYANRQGGGLEQVPKKDSRASHMCDALQYLVVGALHTLGYGWLAAKSNKLKISQPERNPEDNRKRVVFGGLS